MVPRRPHRQKFSRAVGKTSIRGSACLKKGETTMAGVSIKNTGPTGEMCLGIQHMSKQKPRKCCVSSNQIIYLQDVTLDITIDVRVNIYTANVPFDTSKPQGVAPLSISGARQTCKIYGPRLLLRLLCCLSTWGRTGEKRYRPARLNRRGLDRGRDAKMS